MREGVLAAKKSLPMERVIVALALCGFALYLAAGIANHEAWRDEWQAVNIARAATSLPDLYQRLRYEGHPALWYLVIKGVWQIHPSLLAVQAVNAAFAVAAAGLIAFMAPWPLWLRLMVAFSGSAAWEYSVKARSYGLGWLMIVALALALRCSSQRWKPWLVVLFAILALNTSIFSGFVAFALVAGWLLQEYRDQRLRPLVLPLVLLAAASLATLWLALPPSDVSIGNLAEPRNLDFNDHLQTLRCFADGVLPNTGIGKTWIVLTAVAATTAAATCLRYLCCTPAPRLALICGWSVITLFVGLRIIPYAYPWHLWHLFLLPFAASLAFQPKDEARGGSLAVLAILAAIGLNSGIKDYVADRNSVYSGALAAARAIKDAGLERLPVVIDAAPMVASLSGYLGRPLYDCSSQPAHSYMLWRGEGAKNPNILTRGLVLAAAAPEKKSVFVTSMPLPDNIGDSLPATFDLTPVGSFTAKGTDEDYHVYLLALK